MPLINDEWSAGARPPIDSPNNEARHPSFTIAGHDANKPLPRPEPKPSAETPIADVHKTIVGVNKALQSHLDNVTANEANYSEDGMRAQIASFADTEDARRLDAAEKASIDHEKAVKARYAAELKATSPRNGDTASQPQAQRDWARHKAVFDVQEGGKLAATAQQALGLAEAEELGTLAAELPAYLKSRGLPDDWVKPALAQANPRLGALQREVADAARERTIVQYNVAALRNGIEKGHAVHTLVDPSGGGAKS